MVWLDLVNTAHLRTTSLGWKGVPSLSWCNLVGVVLLARVTFLLLLVEKSYYLFRWIFVFLVCLQSKSWIYWLLFVPSECSQHCRDIQHMDRKLALHPYKAFNCRLLSRHSLLVAVRMFPSRLNIEAAMVLITSAKSRSRWVTMGPITRANIASCSMTVMSPFSRPYFVRKSDSLLLDRSV